ncbi:phage tail tape measure protein [Aeromicrobium phragmitis]|uniref:Phage tail tape measure protein n=1 Tax=Aeromicrobium phragmitis TaxID=2478914 RepID=A0A3L8PL57_9ACTN|nr:phage tail tape measure protein [Aeromicrobium phragmitis]RLV56061.1 phage tail tape measure protein [Aeromicrobium phragmitis]
MALDVGDLVARLRLDTGPFDRDSRTAEGKFGAWGGRLGKVAIAAGATVAAAMGAAAYQGVQAFAEFESGMNEVFTLLPGISEQAMGDMSDQVKQFSMDFGVLPNEVVPALYQSLSAGVPPDNVFDFLETAQMAAKGGVTELTTAVDGISSVVNAYGDEILDATQASDLMFTAVRLGKTNFEELSGSLYNVTPTAAALGVEFGDITAAMAQMTAQGVPTSVATTQLRQLFVELSKEGGAASDAFKEIAGEGFADFIAGGGNVADALDIMQQAADENDVALQDMFGSVEAGAAALSLAAGGTDSYRAAMDEMANSAGATEAAYNQMDQGLSASWDRIKAAGSVALIDLGEQLAPFVSDVADLAEQALPSLVGAVGSVGDAFTAAGDAVGVATDFLEDHEVAVTLVAGAITGVLVAALTVWMTRTVVAAATNTIAWFTTAAASQTSAAVQSKSALQVVIGWLLMGARALGQGLIIAGVWAAQIAAAAVRGAAVFLIQAGLVVGGWVLMGAQAMAQAARMAAAWFIALGPIGWAIAAIIAVVVLIIAYWDEIKAATQAAWEWVVEQVKKVPGAIVSFFMNWTLPGLIIKHWDKIKSTFRNGVSNVVQWMRDLPGRILGAVGNLGSLLWGVGEDIMRGLRDGIDRGLEWVKSKLGGVGKLIPGWLKDVLGISSPSKVMRDQVGLWIPAGIAEGVERGMPGLRSTITGMVDDVVVPIDAAAAYRSAVMTRSWGASGALAPTGRVGGAGYGGPLVEQHVHAAPGMSEEAIGDAAEPVKVFV